MSTDPRNRDHGAARPRLQRGADLLGAAPGHRDPGHLHTAPAPPGSPDDVAVWTHCVDGLLRALRDPDAPVPGLSAKLEELRHRRDTVEVKARAVERHRGERLERARREYAEALREMRAAWRSVLTTLHRHPGN